MKRTKLLAMVEYFKLLRSIVSGCIIRNEKNGNGSLQKKNVKKEAWNLRLTFMEEIL